MALIEHEIRKDLDENTKIVNLTPLKAIRHHCIECVGFSYLEVELCQSPLCPLYPFRMGTIPGRKTNNPKGKGGFGSKKRSPQTQKSKKKGSGTTFKLLESIISLLGIVRVGVGVFGSLISPYKQLNVL